MGLPTPTFIGQQATVDGKTYQVVALNPPMWKGISNGNKEIRLRFAEKSAAHMTLAEVKADETLIVGQYVRLTDRGECLFQVKAGLIANELDIIALDNGLFLELDDSDAHNLAAYGTSAAAFDAARAKVVNNGTIYAGATDHVGTYSMQFEELKGEGTVTKFIADDIYPVMTLNRKTSSLDWDFYKISDLSFDGKETGVKASACVTFSLTDPFAGRCVFDNVQFFGGDVGVLKPTGNIGDGYYNCNFQKQDFGWKATSSEVPVMHTGAVVFQQTNFDVIEKACVYSIDNVDGAGAISMRDSLMQGCNGFGVFIDMNNFVPFVPHTFDNLWMELIAKNATTEIDGVTYTTRQARFKDTPYAVFKGTYIKSMELVNSVIHATDCRMDDASGSFDFVADTGSMLIVDDMYGNGEIGDVPFVRSIANQVNSSPTKNCSVRGPLKVATTALNRVGVATNVCSNSFSAASTTFVGTASVATTSVDDGVLNDTCEELTIPDGYTLLSPQFGTPTNGTWAVWGIHAKLVSGAKPTRFRIGFDWTAGKVYTRDSEWVCSYGIKQVGSAGQCRLEIVNSTGAPITVRLENMFCVTFLTRQQALEFVNSGFAIKNLV